MRIVLSALLVCSFVGCGKKKEGGEASPSATSKSAEVILDTSKPNARSTNGDPVDVCGQLPKDKVEAAIGKTKGDPKPTEGQGSMLGQCTWSMDAGFAMVSTRPANEYDHMVEVAGESKPVAGLGEKAFLTKAGMLVQPAGKPYMLQVVVAGGDDKQTEALAKLAVDTLK